MRITPLLIILALILQESCTGLPQESYRNYQVTDLEATPINQTGGAPYRKRP